MLGMSQQFNVILQSCQMCFFMVLCDIYGLVLYMWFSIIYVVYYYICGLSKKLCLLCRCHSTHPQVPHHQEGKPHRPVKPWGRGVLVRWTSERRKEEDHDSLRPTWHCFLRGDGLSRDIKTSCFTSSFYSVHNGN